MLLGKGKDSSLYLSILILLSNSVKINVSKRRVDGAKNSLHQWQIDIFVESVIFEIIIASEDITLFAFSYVGSDSGSGRSIFVISKLFRKLVELKDINGCSIFNSVFAIFWHPT